MATLNWTYDGVGHRLSETLAGTLDTYVYPPTSNRLDSITRGGGTIRSFAYDAIGNIVTDTRGGDVISYTYDDRNRPVTVARYGGSWASYGYNALEQLVIRATTVPVGPIGGSHYVYDLDGHLIAEADALTGATIREYLWLNERPVAIVDMVSTTPVLYFVHSDHLARPVLVTDASKASVWSAVWRPFGEALSIAGPLSLDARFSGQWFQIETGLAYNWHRHYDAAIGRYIQPDPLGFVDGPSVYGYARSSPLKSQDFDGRDITIVVGSPTRFVGNPSQSGIGNPFGHVAVGIEGRGTFSFGTGTVPGSKFSDYLRSQSEYRNSTGFILPTDETTDECVASALKAYTSDMPEAPSYAALNDNCSTRTSSALKSCGVKIPIYSLPAGFIPWGLKSGLRPISLKRGGTISNIFGRFDP